MWNKVRIKTLELEAKKKAVNWDELGGVELTKTINSEEFRALLPISNELGTLLPIDDKPKVVGRCSFATVEILKQHIKLTNFFVFDKNMRGPQIMKHDRSFVTPSAKYVEMPNRKNYPANSNYRQREPNFINLSEFEKVFVNGSRNAILEIAHEQNKAYKFFLHGSYQIFPTNTAPKANAEGQYLIVRFTDGALALEFYGTETKTFIKPY